MNAASSIHASCVLVGAGAVLIRGPSGAGKSRLALALLQAPARGELAFTRLVADDRTRLEAIHGRLLARPVPELAGLIELRHIGIRSMPYEAVAAVTLIIDLTDSAPRLPEAAERTVQIAGITLPRLALPSAAEGLPLVLAELSALATSRWDTEACSSLSEK